jgi:phosphoglycolate phosphatase-like HAD superfamily hydrolase
MRVRKSYILFDHDGVLVDTEHWYFEAGRRALSQIGMTVGKDQYLEAKLLAQHFPGAVLKEVDREGTVLDVVLGNRFTALTPVGEVPWLPPLPKKGAETVARPGVCSTTAS